LREIDVLSAFPKLTPHPTNLRLLKQEKVILDFFGTKRRIPFSFTVQFHLTYQPDSRMIPIIKKNSRFDKGSRLKPKNETDFINPKE